MFVSHFKPAAILLLLSLTPCASKKKYIKEGVYKPGEVPDEPVRVNKENFQTLLEDKANPLWLLKFYAPWCGHCKKLAPVLDRVSREVAGKMAIGKIDCTSTGAPLCKEFDVKGYPTLLFALDGEVQEFPYGRSEEELLQFANKMNSLSVEPTFSVEDAYRYAKKYVEEEIVYLAYDPASAGNAKLDDKMNASPFLQDVAFASRKEQAFAHFLLLEPPVIPAQIGEEGQEIAPARIDTSVFGDLPQKPFLCRLEVDFPVRCWTDDKNMQHWVRSSNIPTVNDLGPRNFYNIGRKGRPLVIGVWTPTTTAESGKDPKDDMIDRLTQFATSTHPAVDEYYFGYMQGEKRQHFLEQFNVFGGPQIFVLDFPSKTYWQDETLSWDQDIGKLLEAKASGRLPGRPARRPGVNGVFDMLSDFMERNLMATSIVILIVLFVSYVSLAHWAASEDVPVSAHEALLAAEKEAEQLADQQLAAEGKDSDELKKDL